jgi:hypothetical protein
MEVSVAAGALKEVNGKRHRFNESAERSQAANV